MSEHAETLRHPRATHEVIGHEAAERLFLEAFNSDRLHHAWLISGPKGVGKATLAWKFAKFLLTRPNEDDGGFFGVESFGTPTSLAVSPDDSAVQRIIAGGHGGVMVAERTMNDKTGKLRNDIIIDDVRKLIGFFSQTSAEGGWRVAIVDAADEMNPNAANALLKLLEEPPAKSILLLVSHSPGRLLPTIRSRCRALNLKALPEDSVQAVLAGRFPSLSPDDLKSLARLSEGAPGKAIELASLNGVQLYRQMAEELVGLPRVNMPRIHALADKLAAPKADGEYRLFIEMLLGWLERMVRQAASGQAMPDIMAGEGAAMARISAFCGLDQWLDLWEKMGHLVSRADAVNLDRRQVIVNLFASLGAACRG
ncbi:MAG: DNA polymerase III subunit delta' [Alphaproteobacteria bacterium]|nr:MAG: DNA polymerase III subunit delta' [Alphaproteobacteria bacterium]